MKYRRIALAALLCLLPLCPSLAADQPAARPAQGEAEEVNTGQDITRPLTRFDLRYEYQNYPRLESNKDDAHVITMRVDKPFEFGPKWKLATRLDLPLMFTDRVSKDNTRGNTHFGMGDVLAQALLVNIVTDKLAWAAGAQVVFPTATEEEMGTGKYRAVPTAAVRWKTDDIMRGSWVAFAARWDRSFAESRSDSTTVNELQFAPIVNIMLPGYWFINLFPSTDIRYNLGDKRKHDSGRWFVPANFMVGKMLSKDVVTSLEVGVPIINDYQVYDFKIEFRLGYFF